MFKYIREMSDVHLEFGSYDVQELDTDKETVLVLAGDIHVKDRAEKSGWIEELCSRFFHVIRILGNHEHYRSSIDRTVIKIRRQVEHLANYTVLDNETLILESVFGPVKFIGTTLWTNFNKGCPSTIWAAERSMNDYKLIRHMAYARKVRPIDLIGYHRIAKEFIEREAKTELPCVVITHHAPTFVSIGEMYKGDYLGNGAYASDLSDLILDHPSIKLWFHGHIHDVSDYQVGDGARVICNPRGYYGHELVDEFNPTLRLDVKDLYGK